MSGETIIFVLIIAALLFNVKLGGLLLFGLLLWVLFGDRR